jgi:tetratricopeptide (TPR) repeat protein
VAAAYRIQSTPALIYFDAQGRELDRSSGYIEWDTLLRRTAEAVSPKTNYVLLKERLKNDPGDVEALYYMGYKYTRRNDFDRASKYFERVRELDPDNARAFFDNIALREIEEFQGQGKFDEALAALDQFAKSHPASDEADVAAILRARLLLQTEQLDASLAAYEQFLKQYPDSLWAPQARASLEALRVAFASPVRIGDAAASEQSPQPAE